VRRQGSSRVFTRLRGLGTDYGTEVVRPCMLRSFRTQPSTAHGDASRLSELELLFFLSILSSQRSSLGDSTVASTSVSAVRIVSAPVAVVRDMISMSAGNYD
jgi:hypothetical protein